MNILHIILKHVVWRFRICNYFRKIFKFGENMSKTDFAKFLKVFIKSRNLNIYLHVRERSEIIREGGLQILKYCKAEKL